MQITEMTSKECHEALERIGFGRLGCARGNQPYVVPVYFAYDHSYLYAFSTPGRKIYWMRANPQVCIEVDEITDHYNWMSVVALGEYEELADTPEHKASRLFAELLLEKRSLWWQIAYAANGLRGQPEVPPPIFFRIHIEEVSGYRGSPDPVETAVRLTRSPHV